MSRSLYGWIWTVVSRDVILSSTRGYHDGKGFCPARSERMISMYYVFYQAATASSRMIESHIPYS